MTDPDNPYTRFQQDYYEAEAAKWTPADRDPVVGSFDRHNAWADYDLLFAGIGTAGKVALDFGCGPGRCLVKYAGRFARVDGADLAAANLAAARTWLAANGVAEPTLYHTDGVSLSGVPGAAYDVVYSTICLQHIPVREIRSGLFREFARVLRPGGVFTAQMGFGATADPRGVAYFSDRWLARATNGGCDVVVADPDALRIDLVAAGFDGASFSYTVRPTGPGDWHRNWIFFRAGRGGHATR
jgi:ubiquinone/menaquinone biosynthesis C-methylase UbiE